MKIIQIAIEPFSEGTPAVLYGLDEEGNLWYLKVDKFPRWKLLISRHHFDIEDYNNA